MKDFIDFLVSQNIEEIVESLQRRDKDNRRIEERRREEDRRIGGGGGGQIVEEFRMNEWV